MAVVSQGPRPEALVRANPSTPWGPVLGLLMAVLLNAVAAFGYIRFRNYSGFTDHFNAIGVTFLFFLLCWPIAGLLGKVFRRYLSAADRALIYFCLMLATVVPTMGLCGYLLPLISGVSYYATAENGWQQLIVEQLPSWTMPTQGRPITWFYDALPPGELVPWGAWQTPLLFWGAFFLVLSVVAIAAMVLMRRQWQEHEHLTYPLTALPLELIGAGTYSRARLWRNAAFWSGVGLALVLTFWNAGADLLARNFMLSVPHARYGVSFEAFRKSMWIGFNFDPLVIGLSYLVSLDVLLSVWFFYWVSTVSNGTLNVLGITRAVGNPHAAGGGIFAPIQSGAMLFLAGLAIYNGRHHLRATWRGLAGDEEEIAPYRLCWALLLGGLGVMWYMLTLTGLPAHLAAFVLVTAMGFWLGTTLLLAQTGLGRLRAPNNPFGLVQDLWGTARLTPAQTSALGYTFTWGGDIQLFTMGTAAMGLQALNKAKVDRPRSALPTGIAAVALSLVTAFVCYLAFAYRYGAHSGFGWYFEASPPLHWGIVANAIRSGTQASPVGWALLLGGGALTLLVDFMHRAYSWWPLHPAGLAISQINTTCIDWFSMFLSWLLKTLVLHYGGAGLYRASVPFFLGLVLGSCTGVSLSFFVNMLTA